MVWAMPDAGHVEADLLHRHLELLAVLGGGDRLGVGADQLDAVAVEHARLDELHGQVQRGLAAERRQHRVGPLPLDDPGEDVDVERLDVGGVGELRVGHDRGRVRVGQDDPVALLAQDPAGLGARVVELAGLADDDRAGADEQDRLEVACASASAGRPARSGAVTGVDSVHQLGELGEQVGRVVRPGPASGWCCTEKAGTSMARMPSLTPSLRFTWVTSAPGTEPSATAKLWFWLVISTAPSRGGGPGGCRRGGRTAA